MNFNRISREKLQTVLCRMPKAELLSAGVAATVNSDDPAYFGGYLNENYTATFAALPELGVEEAYRLARNSFEASFVAESVREGWIMELDEFFGNTVGSA